MTKNQSNIQMECMEKFLKLLEEAKTKNWITPDEAALINYTRRIGGVPENIFLPYYMGNECKPKGEDKVKGFVKTLWLGAIKNAKSKAKTRLNEGTYDN